MRGADELLQLQEQDYSDNIIAGIGRYIVLRRMRRWE